MIPTERPEARKGKEGPEGRGHVEFKLITKRICRVKTRISRAEMR